MLALRTYNHLSSSPVNTLLNEWSRMWPTPQPVSRTHSAQRARLACREHEDRHEVFAALPGLRKSELAIEVVDTTLVLKRVVDGDADQDSTASRPFAISKGFEHRIALPEDGELSKISAHLESGILTITIPKKAEAAPVAIEISGE